MTLPTIDTERFSLVESQLHTPVIGDILDALGHHHQFLSPAIRPLHPSKRLVGRAMPVLISDVFGIPSKILMSLASLAAVAQVVTGTLMWWKRPRRRPTASARR